MSILPARPPSLSRLSSSSSYNSSSRAASLSDDQIDYDTDHVVMVDAIHDKLKTASISELTSEDFDSWIFYCEYEKEQGRWSGHLVLGFEKWDVGRLRRWREWREDVCK